MILICSDIDQCADQSDNCSEYSVCTNIYGAFTCKCMFGTILPLQHDARLNILRLALTALVPGLTGDGYSCDGEIQNDSSCDKSPVFYGSCCTSFLLSGCMGLGSNQQSCDLGRGHFVSRSCLRTAFWISWRCRGQGGTILRCAAR